MAHDDQLIERTLAEARSEVLGELARALAVRRQTGYGPLYDLLSDYPFREGKGLRPAICISSCRSVGGWTEQALASASALELFHNAFLVHDDVEDDSQLRRGSPTLRATHGVPVAVNVGDATNVLAVSLLLENTARIGVRKSLLVFREIERMARESVEGQAIELDWIASGEFDLTESDYVRMSYKKTCWYTVIAPLRIGVICGSSPGVAAPVETDLTSLIALGFFAGVAFQIQDDLLNLATDRAQYGKETAGDLWEGKRTVMLLHFLRTCAKADRARALRLLKTPRREKSADEVAWLHGSMSAAGSIEHGRAVAQSYCQRALEIDGTLFVDAPASDDRRFLREMLNYVVDRLW